MANSSNEVDERARLEARLTDQWWRLNNLYYIKDKNGRKVLFRLNWAQTELVDGMHNYNVILKSRQLGFTTFCMIYFLDACLFNSHHATGVVAHTREAAEDLFRNKIRFAYDNLPAWLRAQVKAKSETARMLEFANGSTIAVGTSLRSGTFQKLLISEYGKVSVREPEKAVEIKTGALNTIASGQQIFIESTAEGQAGEYYDIVQRARELQASGIELTTMDPKFFFFPWYREKQYALPDNQVGSVSVPDDTRRYFEELEAKFGIKLTAGQKAWYVKKKEEQGEHMLREYPSTPDEAFRGSMEGTFFSREIKKARADGRICYVPYESSRMVDTFWDLGNDGMSVWFFQHIGLEYRFIDHYRGTNIGGLPAMAKILRDKGYIYGTHHFPWDGGNSSIQTDKGTQQIAEELGIRPVKIVPRTKDKKLSIEKCRPVLNRAKFDSVKCADGIKSLESYRKKWNASVGEWTDEPLHDKSSHDADAFRTFSDGYEGRNSELVGGAYNNGVDVFADTDYDVLGI